MSISNANGAKARPHRRKPPRRNQNAPVMDSTEPSAPAPARINKPPLTIAVSSESPRFSDLLAERLLNPVLIQTITEDLGFEHMTPVQEATLRDLLKDGQDCLAQAKTGTGKTIAFLLPAIQTLMNKGSSKFISLLVISPTRELAMQIAEEASALLKRLPQYKVRIAIGGTNQEREQRDILAGCDILVATPGRLYDHMGDQRIARAFTALDTLVLDEADRLLDMGFMNAIKDIIACLPDKREKPRQGMLFSATTGPHVEKFAHLVLSPGYKFISTIPVGELNTHAHVIQHLITVPSFNDVLPATLAAIRTEVSHDPTHSLKAILFAPTAALADWYAFVLSHAHDIPSISVLHARISQSKRTKVTEAFRTASSAILVATDVVARGMDFPNVSTVFQVGIPADRESYIHRLGRTARAGKDGRGIFIITEAEAYFPKARLRDITFVDTLSAATSQDEAMVQNAAVETDTQAKTYQGWLGYYKNHLKGLGWTPERLVAEGNRYAIDTLRAGGVPEIQKSTVGKMGLKGVKGLNVVPNLPRAGRGGGEGRRAQNRV